MLRDDPLQAPVINGLRFFKALSGQWSLRPPYRFLCARFCQYLSFSGSHFRRSLSRKSIPSGSQTVFGYLRLCFSIIAKENPSFAFLARSFAN